MRFSRTKRDHLHDWLWAMYERSYQEECRLRSLGQPKEAQHYQKQMRTISNLLAQMTRMEHPVTR